MLIQCKITEANTRYKFNEDDLIIVMWTTMCREDHYVRGNWLHTGNIFTQTDYDETFVRKFADTTGYLIRDMALITMSTSFLKSLPATTVVLNSVPWDNQQDMTDPRAVFTLEMYAETVQSVPPCLFELEMNGHWDFGHSFYDPHHCTPGGPLFNDYHPSTQRYYNYLKKLGFNLTDASLAYTIKSMEELSQAKTLNDLLRIFEYLQASQHRPML